MRRYEDAKSQGRCLLRKYHSQHRWKMFGVAFCLFCSLPTCDALLKRSLNTQSNSCHLPTQKKRPVPSSKTRAAICTEGGLDDSWKKSNRMSEQPSIAEHLLASHENEFVVRLLAAEESERSIVVPPDPVSSLVVYGVLILALSSAVLTPPIFVETLWTLVLSVTPILLPWLWIGQASSLKETAIMGLTAAVQLVPRQGFKDNLLFQKVLPLALEALQKMIVMEAFSRVWSRFGRAMGNSMTNFFRNLTFKQNDNVREQWVPDWLIYVHEFLDTSIRKGSQKAIIKTLELNVQAAVGVAVSSVFRTVAQYVELAVLQCIVLFRPEDILLNSDSL